MGKRTMTYFGLYAGISQVAMDTFKLWHHVENRLKFPFVVLTIAQGSYPKMRRLDHLLGTLAVACLHDGSFKNMKNPNYHPEINNISDEDHYFLIQEFRTFRRLEAEKGEDEVKK